jgi:hypothetical protein
MAKKVQSATSKNKQPPAKKPWLKCGEVGTYAKLNDKRAEPTFERDHVPAKATMLKAAEKSFPGMSTAKFECVARKLEAQALTIAIPYGMHRDYSRTCGSGNNTPAQIDEDSDDLDSAVRKDLMRIQKHLDGPPKHSCAEPYREAARQVRAQDHQGLINKVITECPG